MKYVIKNICSTLLKRSNKDYNKLILYIILAILFLCAIWAIIAIDLHIIPRVKINMPEQYINGLNRVFINLSYSYLAGWILYAVTVLLPGYHKKVKFRPVIKCKVNDISNILHQACLNFAVPVGTLNKNPYWMDKDNLEKAMIDKNWSNYSILPTDQGKTILESFSLNLGQLNDYVGTFISDYKHILSTEQIIILESIRNNPLFSFLSLAGSSKCDLSVYAKEAIVKMFFEITNWCIELQKT